MKNYLKFWNKLYFWHGMVLATISRKNDRSLVSHVRPVHSAHIQALRPTSRPVFNVPLDRYSLILEGHNATHAAQANISRKKTEVFLFHVHLVNVLLERRQGVCLLAERTSGQFSDTFVLSGQGNIFWSTWAV